MRREVLEDVGCLKLTEMSRRGAVGEADWLETGFGEQNKRVGTGKGAGGSLERFLDPSVRKVLPKSSFRGHDKCFPKHTETSSPKRPTQAQQKKCRDQQSVKTNNSINRLSQPQESTDGPFLVPGPCLGA